LPALVSALSACAAIDPVAFVPHESTAPQIDARMGVPAEVRQLAGGETIRFYPRFPWRTYAARVGTDSRLVSFEQVITLANADELHSGASTIGDVRDLLVQFTPDGVVREVFLVDEHADNDA